MSDGSRQDRAPLKHTRDVTIEALMEHFANDVIEVDEFERRLDAAHGAKTSDELKALLNDLPGGANLPAVRDRSGTRALAERPVMAAAHSKESELILAVMSGSTRRGSWRPARRSTCVTVMGGAEIDFREAILPPGVTELRVFALMGGAEVIVPPGVNVEANGFALLGGFDHQTDEAEYDPEAPTIRITGVAVMGGVEVSTRHPGESARDAKRRRKQLRREHRRRLRGG